MPPILGHGKICYVGIPAIDPNASAAFYRTVFGWNIRMRQNGEVTFDDGAGQVSGVWVKGKPALDASFVYIMCDDMTRTCDAIRKEGGEIVQGPDPAAREVTALFKDPAGNVFGLYEDPGLKSGKS